MAHHGTPDLLVLHERGVCLPTHGPAVNVEHGISLVLQGSLGFDCGQEIRVGPGSIVLVPAGVPHRSLGGEDLTYWLVGFCGACHGFDESMPLMEPFARVRGGGLPVVGVDEARLDWVTRLFEELARESETPSGRSHHLLSLI
ncbi:MAG: AraC family ligand binding domain-containing protein, partial [Myxococcota bacterium]